MTLYPNHPALEKREMLRIDGIIEPARFFLRCLAEDNIVWETSFFLAKSLAKQQDATLTIGESTMQSHHGSG